MTKIELKEYQRLLFRTTFCLMACDGDIDEREIKEIREMDQSASFFQGIDLADELESLLADLTVKGKKIVEELFVTLDKIDLSIVQELLLLEVAFRLIYADQRVDENEIKFLKLLRSKLKVDDSTIRDRFGEVEYLFEKGEKVEMRKDLTKDEFFNRIAITEMKHLEVIDFSTYQGKE
jgi:hypothetical protein